MSMTMTLVLMVQVLSALTMIGLILVQQGKGADMGAALGSGSAGSLFGASGSANFLSRMTALCATVFFASTLALALMASSGMQRPTGDGGPSVLENVPLIAPVETGPAAAIPGAGAASGTPAQTEAEPTGNTTVDAIPGAGDAASTPAQDPAPAAEEAAPEAPAAADAEATEATEATADGEPAEQPAASDAPAAPDTADVSEPAAGEASATAEDATAAESGNPAEAPATAN